MKKALHLQDEPHLYQKNGKIHPWYFTIDEILDAVNRRIKGDSDEATFEAVMLGELYKWISRYLEEGATEGFLNDLNNNLNRVVYHKYIVPPDFINTKGKEPQSIFLDNHDSDYPPQIIAANEFSKLITTGMLTRLRRCQMPDCENIFLGPPQAKWCSKTCGSKYRVRKKRKRDSS